MTNTPFPTRLDDCSKMVAAIRWGMVIGAAIAAVVIILDGRPGGIAGWWPDGVPGRPTLATQTLQPVPESRESPAPEPAARGRNMVAPDDGRAGVGPAAWRGGASGLFARPRRQP